MSDHDTIEELIAVRSLGGLDAGDLAHLEELMAAHGPGCLECQRLRDQYAEVAGRLAFAVSPEEIPADLEDRLVQRAVRPLPPSRWASRRVVAAVAAAVILVAGGVGGYLLAPRHAGLPEDVFRHAKVVSLTGPGGGVLSLAVKSGSSHSYLIGTGLSPAPRGHVYELWFFHGKTPLPAATFTPTEGLALVRVPADAKGASLAAITIERAPGAQRPTTHPIYSGRLTAS